MNSALLWWLPYNSLRKHHIHLSETSFETNGKLYFVDEHCYFNITHCKTLCEVAISDTPIGVDMEACKRKHKSQIPISVWYQLFRDSAYADACLSRMTSKAYHVGRPEATLEK